jgi:putative membrane protein
MEDQRTSGETGTHRAGDAAGAHAPYLVFSGFAMGTADVVPGVSGGTMAVVMGIYEQLLAAIASIGPHSGALLLKGRPKAALAEVHWRFLVALGSGIALGIGVMVKIVGLPRLIEEQPKFVYAAFFGLVLASAIMLGRRIASWTGSRALSLLLGALAGFAVVNLVPVATPESTWFVFLSGVVAICAMVLPGISGSFVLLILGKYAYVLNAVGDLDLAVIVPFALGCALGLAGFSRVVSWALARWHETVMACLVGLLLGSLWRIWPYQELTTVIVRDKPRVIAAEPFLPQNLEWNVVLLVAAGMALVFALEWFAARRGRR